MSLMKPILAVVLLMVALLTVSSLLGVTPSLVSTKRMSGWTDIAAEAGGITVFVALCLAPPLMIAYLVWKGALHSKPLRPFGAALLFGVASGSSCAVYGHAGPVPAMLLLFVNDAAPRRQVILWLVANGLLIASGLTLWSRRVVK